METTPRTHLIRACDARVGDVLRVAKGQTRKVDQLTITAVETDGPTVWLTVAERSRRVSKHALDKIVVAR